MLDRVNYPYGWACPAGHIDEREGVEEALLREVKEETDLEIGDYKLLIHEFIDWNECAQGVRGHDWYVFEIINWEGNPKEKDKEAKQFSWIAPAKLKKLNLEPVWEHWFKKLKII